MKAAIPVYDHRISPLFDAARNLMLVDIEGGEEIRRSQHLLGELELVGRARQVAELDVDVLICGAVSTQLTEMLQAVGVQVIPQICGPVEDVLSAFLTDELTDTVFLMPGHGQLCRQQEGSQSPTTGEAYTPIDTGFLRPTRRGTRSREA